MAIKMKRKCKKNEEITMKKQKDGLAFCEVIFLLLYHSRRKITELKSPDCESRCNSCLPYH